MKKLWMLLVALLTGAFSADIYAAQGEYWEVTTRVEMAGMPFAMPATTNKVCIARGSEKDPRQAAPNKECEMTDIRTSGNKTSWKVRCNHDGDVMTGTGENTGNADSYEGRMSMTGKSQGRNIDMTQTYRGKRIGGSCDTEEQINKIKGEMCDTTKFGTRDWISRADFFLNNPTCPGKKEPLCDAVRKDAPRDADVYEYLIITEKNNGNLIARTCGLSMESTTRTLCKTINAKNYRKLTPYCPTEVNAYREAERKRVCEGRDYTSREGLSRCLNAKDGDDNADEETRSKGESDKSKSGSDNPARSLIDGAKKLKGFFGF